MRPQKNKRGGGEGDVEHVGYDLHNTASLYRSVYVLYINMK